MNKMMKRKYLIIIIVILIASAVALILPSYLENHSKTESNAGTSSAGNVVLIKSMTGGLCAVGSTCHSEDTLYENGEYTSDKKLSKDDVNKLKQLIDQSDWNQYGVNDSTNCPSALDGLDVAYIFPSRYGDKRFTLCQINIPSSDTLLTYINELNL